MKLYRSLALLALLHASWAQAQSSQKLFAGVATLFDNQRGAAGLYVTALETPAWKNVAWPDFSVRAAAPIVMHGAPRLLLAGPSGVVRPFSNPTGWQLLTPSNMGEVLDLKLDVENGQTIFAATTRGVFVSEDQGKTWQARNQGLLNQFVGCLLLDPKQGGRIWAGTEAGLYESFNDGKEWALVAFEGLAIRALLREPESWPGIYWVGTEYHGLFESFDGGEKFDPVDMESDSVSVYALAGGGANAPIYAGLFAKGLFRASSPGENWAPIAGSAQLGSVLAILPLADQETIIVGTHQNGVLRSMNFGRTWQSLGLKGVPVRTLLLGETEWYQP